ncbi:zinc finger protein 737-like isoform X1 [Bradysia coprophila]|uniref:zinc finger protein 737-like isoform X1 n=1 Tax=Bradysia coprophila TaxID=38358 RepID=UPI00187DC574|nr:zinc finger protein 737-like isoform X1 [Bradysia coprophila]
MTTSISFNISDVCRGCLSDNRDNLRSIFDSNILENFISCTNVQVTAEDGLPKHICNSCVYKVVSWVTFKSQCEQNDEILRTTFQCSVNKQSLSSTSQPSGETCSKNIVDVISDSSFQSDSAVTVQQCSEIDNSNVDESENTKPIGEHIDCVKPDAYDDEEFLVTANDEDIDESDVDQTVDSGKTQSSPQKQVTCDECGAHFRNSDRLKSHRRSVHEGKKPEVCPICDKEFNNLRALRRHRHKHSDLKQFRCDDCGRWYKYQTSLTLHKKSHADVRRFICDLCGKAFVRAHGLQSHLLSHSTLTPFTCDYESCGKQFKNAIMLRNHQKRHLGIKTFVCSPDCGKEFITAAELNTHIRSHTGSKPFACTMCDKAYKTKSHLTVHLRSHSGSRPYACDICPLTFAHNKVLKHHRLVHLGELPWSCDICQRPFRQRSTLMKHKKLHTDGKARKNQPQHVANSDFTGTETIQLSIEMEDLEK